MTILNEILDIAHGVYKGAKNLVHGKTSTKKSLGFFRIASIVAAGVAGFFIGGPIGVFAGAALAAAAWQYGSKLLKWIAPKIWPVSPKAPTISVTPPESIHSQIVMPPVAPRPTSKLALHNHVKVIPDPAHYPGVFAPHAPTNMIKKLARKMKRIPASRLGG